ncbi:GNAT family N-acetyltransferase [Skermanella rosea]|nr:GNAT family N-acetyltransferase [Skermanella rosea]UEM06731.1 GNAT family N-acetyltransferase [Skermanella rosea]
MRPLELSDAGAVQDVFPRWEIVRFLAGHVPWPYPADGALSYIRDVALPAMERGTEWHWSIRPRPDPDRLIGVISLMDKPDDNRGLWLDPAWQGRGLMTEASAAAIHFWFEALGRPVLRVQKAEINLRSRRLSERDGMRLVGTHDRDFVSGRFPAGIWEITREEWRRR